MYYTVISLVAQMVKSLPAMQATWVQSLGQEGPLEKEMATQSSILVWEIPWTEELGELQSMGSQRVRHDGAQQQMSIIRTLQTRGTGWRALLTRPRTHVR